MDPDRLSITPEPTADERAAIALAIEAYLDTKSDETARGDDGDWSSRRFRFQGRLEGFGQETRRPPRTAPTNPWRAAGRIDRY